MIVPTLPAFSLRKAFLQWSPKMNNDYPHDLAELMQQVTDTMATDYNRIRKRSKEDPGTAGDKGEEDWAVLLREWLPPL